MTNQQAYPILAMLARLLSAWPDKGVAVTESRILGARGYRMRGTILLDGIEGGGFESHQRLAAKYRGLKLAFSKGKWVMIRARYIGSDWSATNIIEAPTGDHEAIDAILSEIDFDDILLAVIGCGKRARGKAEANLGAVRREVADLETLRSNILAPVIVIGPAPAVDPLKLEEGVPVSDGHLKMLGFDDPAGPDYEWARKSL